MARVAAEILFRLRLRLDPERRFFNMPLVDILGEPTRKLKLACVNGELVSFAIKASCRRRSSKVMMSFWAKCR